MNVNGELEVYLPESTDPIGSQVAVLLQEVGEDWTTNVMVIYVESDKYYNVPAPRLLDEDRLLWKEVSMNYDQR